LVIDSLSIKWTQKLHVWNPRWNSWNSIVICNWEIKKTKSKTRKCFSTINYLRI